jgi:hypothetical protein
VTRLLLDSVQNGCGHGGADSQRSENRHRCVEKTCEGGEAAGSISKSSLSLVGSPRTEGVAATLTRQHEAASIRRQPWPRGMEKAEVRGGSQPVSGEALLYGAGNKG